jgi:hypothetical protein
VEEFDLNAGENTTIKQQESNSRPPCALYPSIAPEYKPR